MSKHTSKRVMPAAIRPAHAGTQIPPTVMNFAIRLAMLTALAGGFGAARAADHLITFEEPGLVAMGNSPGSSVPLLSQLHDQFLGTFGVSFSSGANYVAVVDHGCCTPSVPNIIGGVTSVGTLSYGTPIYITFFDPANTASMGVTDFVQMRGDFIAIPGTATMNAYDAFGGLLGSVTDTDNDLGVNLSLAFAGIHAFTLTQTSATIGLDNLAFDTVTAVAPAVPEPETYALMLAGVGVLARVARRQRAG